MGKPAGSNYRCAICAFGLNAREDAFHRADVAEHDARLNRLFGRGADCRIGHNERRFGQLRCASGKHFRLHFHARHNRAPDIHIFLHDIERGGGSKVHNNYWRRELFERAKAVGETVGTQRFGRIIVHLETERHGCSNSMPGG